eukprot:3322308-Ditylum_brightwellii.AAC.1
MMHVPMTEGSEQVMAHLYQEFEDLPTLRPRHRAIPPDLLNRAVSRCKTCCSRWSIRKSLPVSTTNAGIGIGTENLGRDENSLGDEDAREGTSSSQPRESVFTDNPHLPNNQLSGANRLLISVYGNTIHDNDGWHLRVGIEDDKIWQQYWLDLTALPNQRYDVPSGAVGRQFLFALADILDGVVERRWNAERFIFYMVVILQCQKGVKSYHNVRQRMEH